MTEAAHTPGDAALFAVQFDGARRSGELVDCRVGDGIDTDHTVGVYVDGERGDRQVHRLVSVPSLQKRRAKPPGESRSLRRL